MSACLSCPPEPGPLEAYAVQFDPMLKTPAQRRGFRTYLDGLLLPPVQSILHLREHGAFKEQDPCPFTLTVRVTYPLRRL